MLDASQLKELEVSPYKKDYPLLTQNPQLSYLDSAATTQRPQQVIDAFANFYTTTNANPLRGLYQLSIKATQQIENARQTIADFIGARNSSEIIFTRNTSESLNLVAQSLGSRILQPGDEVVISIMEHHSNLIPWQQICKKTGAHLVYLRINEDYCITPEELQAKIGSKTKIVSVTQVSNVLGIQNDISAIAARAHEMGAVMIVDGAQSVPHLSVDVEELGCDFLAFSAHKLGGPLGIGVLWGKMSWLNTMDPFLVGGEMIDSVSETSAVWAPVPQKFEAGTQDAAGIYATMEAITYLQHIGMPTLEARERLLATYLVDELNALSFVDVIGPTQGEKHYGSVAFNVRGVHPHDVASILDGSGVCIRAGHHCAQPLLEELKVAMGSTCRASIAAYNDKGDIDALIEGLKNVEAIFHGC